MIYQSGLPRVVVRNKSTIDLHVRDGNETVQRERVLLTWYLETVYSSPYSAVGTYYWGPGSRVASEADENQVGYV